MLKRNIIAAFIFWLLLSYSFIDAQVSMQPLLHELQLSKHSRESFTLHVSNSGAFTENCTLTPLSMDVSEDGQPFALDSTNDRSCVDWMTFEPAEFTLKPKSEKQIHVRIEVPRDVSGTYYAMYRLDFHSEAEKQDSELLSLKRSWAGVLLVNVRSFGNNVKLEPQGLKIIPGRSNVQAAQARFSSDAWRVEVRLKNTGNLMTQAKGNIMLFSESGKLLHSETLEVGRGILLPNKNRTFTASGSGYLPDGMYLLKANITAKRSPQLSHSTPFSVYKGKVYINPDSDELRDLIRASSPGFQLRKQFIDYPISSNAKRYGSILLKNFLDDTLRIFPRLTGWWLGPRGQIELGKHYLDHNRSCEAWFDRQNNEIIIPPKTNYSYKFKINVPEKLDGEYFAGIVFDPDHPRPNLAKELKINRACFLSFVDRKSRVDTIDINNISIRKNAQNNHDLHFKVVNHGNSRIDLLGRANLSLETAPGYYEPVGEPQKVGSSGSWIMPGSHRLVDVEFPELKAGKYEARIIIESPNGNKAWSTFKHVTIR